MRHLVSTPDLPKKRIEKVFRHRTSPETPTIRVVRRCDPRDSEDEYVGRVELLIRKALPRFVDLIEKPLFVERLQPPTNKLLLLHKVL